VSDDVQSVHETGIVGLAIAWTLAAAAVIALAVIGAALWLLLAIVDEVRARRERRRVQATMIPR
jgi:uncharacterized membrane protein (Fun14 family)